MDSTGKGGTYRTFIAAAAFIIILTGCGPSARVAPVPAPPPPAAEALPTTFPEIRALRENKLLDRYERALRVMTLSTDAPTRRKAEALLALHLLDQKRYEEAAADLTIAAADDPLLAPFLRLRLIDAYDNLGRPADAVKVATAIIGGSAAGQTPATTPPAATATSAPVPNTTTPAQASGGALDSGASESSAVTIARLRLPALYAELGDEPSTNAALAQLAGIRIDELTERDFLDLARRLEKSSRADAATEIRMRMLRDYPQGRYTEQVYSMLTALAPSPIDALPVDEATKLAASLARSDRYDQALDLLRRYANRPGATDDRVYQNVRLRALFNSRNYSQIVQETAGSGLDAPTLLIRARSAWRDDKPQQFLAALGEIDQRFPGSKESIEANVLRAKYYITDEIDYEKAAAYLSTAIDAGASGSDGENIWNLGWTYFLWGRYDDALSTFARYIHDYPDGDWKTNSLFWTAKIQEKLGKTAERDAALHQIETEYPYSYYAYRAREIMGEPAVGPTEVPNGAIFPDVAEELAKVAGPRIDTVRALLDLGLTADATREMKLLSAEYPANGGVAFMFADVYLSAGEPFKANGILQRRFRQFVRHGGTGVPQRFWEILFPLHYWETIKAEAERRSLDPYLVASIIRQESGFEPTTVSNAGAVGLMQIMPAEASRIATAAGLPSVTREDLFDPTVNIAVGAAEYAQKLEDMHGNPIFAIAAYNAGEEAVGRWIAQARTGEPDLFVETIPYAETRLYVKTVTRNRFEYRRIYESSTAAQQTAAPPPDQPHNPGLTPRSDSQR